MNGIKYRIYLSAFLSSEFFWYVHCRSGRGVLEKF